MQTRINFIESKVWVFSASSFASKREQSISLRYPLFYFPLAVVGVMQAAHWAKGDIVMWSVAFIAGGLCEYTSESGKEWAGYFID